MTCSALLLLLLLLLLCDGSG
eukprot:SAG11_NODE_6495_length_1302_cov_1.963425_1_plen_20_part_10